MQVGFSGGVPSSVACPVLDMWVCLQKTGKPDMADCAIRHRISVAFRTPTRVYVPTHVYVPSRKFSTCTELVGIYRNIVRFSYVHSGFKKGVNIQVGPASIHHTCSSNTYPAFESQALKELSCLPFLRPPRRLFQTPIVHQTKI